MTHRARRRRMRVLFLGYPDGPSWIPWGRNAVAAASREHDVKTLDAARSVVDQVAVRAVDAVLDPSMMASPELAAAAAGHVRLWQLGRVGYDKLDLHSLASAGIPTANCPGFTSSRSLAEHALLLAMLVLRRYQDLEASVAAGSMQAPTGRQLAGRTLLIIGLGASGRQLARRASAFGMRVIGIGRHADHQLERRYGMIWSGGIDRLDQALAVADVTSLHVPLTADTQLLLNRERLERMPKGAVVVNVSRGGLIDEPALADLVRSGHLSGAGLDTVAGEPAGADHPLRGVPGVFITPHIAGSTEETSRRRSRFGAINISRVGAGLEPLSRIDLTLAPASTSASTSVVATAGARSGGNAG
jgi:phosphoglycerate dehydrogenase-like enzyme